MSGILKQAKEVLGLREEFKTLAQQKDSSKNTKVSTKKTSQKVELAEAL